MDAWCLFCLYTVNQFIFVLFSYMHCVVWCTFRMSGVFSVHQQGPDMVLPGLLLCLRDKKGMHGDTLDPVTLETTWSGHQPGHIYNSHILHVVRYWVG